MARKKLSEAAKKRVRAGRLLLAGKKNAEVADAVGVARQTQVWRILGALGFSPQTPENETGCWIVAVF